MNALAKRSIDANKLRAEAKTLAADLRDMKEQAEHKIVRLSEIAYTVQQHRLWKDWKDPKTGKPYSGISQWITSELGESRMSVYRFIGIRKHLSEIPPETLEKIGSTRCFELVKIAQNKPTLLPKFVKALEKDPDIPVFTLQQQVTNVLAGAHMDSNEWSRWELAIKTEDEPYLIKALAVMQALEAVKNPESPVGRGMHFVALCQDYLTGAQQTSVLKKMEAAGAFNGSFAHIQEDK